MATESPASAGGTAVVIPVGTVDDRLRNQLQAVLAQDAAAPGFEVILSLNVPDAELGARLTGMIPVEAADRVRVVDSSDRRGAAHARNIGARATTATQLAFCDADDLVHQGWLAGLLTALEGADAACGEVVDVFPDERMARWHPPATPGRLPTFLGRPYVLTGNLAVRRSAFDAAGGFDETLTRCEDIAFGWSLAAAGCTMVYAPSAKLDYHHRPGLLPMLRQHFAYGKGMSEVLKRYGVPADDASGARGAPRGLAALRPNNQRVAQRTLGGFARRGAIAAGRAWGILTVRGSRR